VKNNTFSPCQRNIKYSRLIATLCKHFGIIESKLFITLNKHTGNNSGLTDRQKPCANLKSWKFFLRNELFYFQVNKTDYLLLT